MRRLSLGIRELRVSVLQEHIRWFDELAIVGRIKIDQVGQKPHLDLSGGASFSEGLDTELASAFIDKHFQADPGGVVLEIGGGIRPSFRTSPSGKAWPGYFINSDASRRLLELAALIADYHGHKNDMEICLNVAKPLPILGNSLDAVFVSRLYTTSRTCISSSLKSPEF